MNVNDDVARRLLEDVDVDAPLSVGELNLQVKELLRLSLSLIQGQNRDEPDWEDRRGDVSYSFSRLMARLRGAGVLHSEDLDALESEFQRVDREVAREYWARMAAAAAKWSADTFVSLLEHNEM